MSIDHKGILNYLFAYNLNFVFNLLCFITYINILNLIILIILII